MVKQHASILIVLPLPVHLVGDTVFCDTQACNGLRLWLENFDHVTLAVPAVKADKPPEATSDVRALLPTDRLDIHLLPAAWTPIAFLRSYRATRKLLAKLIQRSTHLQFAIGGFWGDWGAVAAIIAANRNRKAAIWTDRVESYVMRFQAKNYSGLRRRYRLLTAGLAARLERYVIKRSAMGLFHGMDTFHAYASYSRSAHLVHDIHLGHESRISPDDLAAKIARPANSILRIAYGGRVHPDKGVADWIDTLAALAKDQVSFEAVWYGDGPGLEFAREKVASLGLQHAVHFYGSVTDRAALMRAFRDADIFLFCHKTLESPRCLVEALLSGTPIVGYDSPYPRDLISGHGGGLLTAANPSALSAALARLAAAPDRLAELTGAAAKDGFPMIDEEVFKHRSDLIKSL